MANPLVPTALDVVFMILWLVVPVGIVIGVALLVRRRSARRTASPEGDALTRL